MDDNHTDEGTPLLTDTARRPNGKRKKATPLPTSQIAIVLVLQVCEPLASQSIYPYINQLVGSLDITGGDERKIGYYAGLIESLFFATEALTVLQWSRISDFTGRKPILLIGLFGLMISMLSFGLSRTFWALVVSRCLTGLLNGNIGVMKSLMGELTDSTNRAEGFALLPISWGFGATVGPLLGGTLSLPQQRFPTSFEGNFWKEYPYFLPCLATSGYVLFAFTLTLCFLKETVKKPKNARDDEANNNNDKRPLPLRKLFTYPVVLSISNYVVLAFLDIAIYALLPLFLSMPLNIGGLDLDPPTIGYMMGSVGAAGATFQAFYFSRVIRHFGVRKAFICSISTLIPLCLLPPTINAAALAFGKESAIVWVLLFALLACLALLDLAFGTIFIYVTASAPNTSSLGAINGLAQTSVSIARAIGPACSTSLFSFSVERNILGGFGVYALLSALSVGALFLANLLPSRLWDEDDEM